ncbi:hypothetical protein TUM15768_20350 [Neisseria gonorrhoeae]|uniref:hypothetical protein n=1 Tax=Neisseria gonorrhoeae TaxID=485 RepID=UPI0014844561|nr:hypothetical protein [Neisseria gonorrhoeae]GFL47074.1 hypothetical protein TUM15768_20350 [Neisseria gonorrhoeae]
MNIKNEIVALISKKIDGGQYSSLENFALSVLREKIINNTVSSDEKLLIINDFLSGFLEFDPETGEPVGETLKIEQMIISF